MNIEQLTDVREFFILRHVKGVGQSVRPTPLVMCAIALTVLRTGHSTSVGFERDGVFRTFEAFRSRTIRLKTDTRTPIRHSAVQGPGCRHEATTSTGDDDPVDDIITERGFSHRRHSKRLRFYRIPLIISRGLLEQGLEAFRFVHGFVPRTGNL